MFIKNVQINALNNRTFAIGSVFLLLFLILVAFCLLVAFSPSVPALNDEELVYTTSGDAPNNKKLLLPSIHDKGSLDLSLVIPAYNEGERLPIMLEDTISYLRTTKYEWEILIVDDGSTDNTSSIALDWVAKRIQNHDIEKNDRVRVCRLINNRGKGGAVVHVSYSINNMRGGGVGEIESDSNEKKGMQHVRGNNVLFVDADGASKFSDIEQLLRVISKIERNGLGAAIGSRAHLVNSEQVVKRSAIRNGLMYSFHRFLRFMGVKKIRDTQCGFKLFTRRAAALVFPQVHLQRWAFDVEVLFVAENLKIPIAEVPIEWHEVQGSKISLISDSARMALDIIMMRMNYAIGIWQVQKKSE